MMADHKKTRKLTKTQYQLIANGLSKALKTWTPDTDERRTAIYAIKDVVLTLAGDFKQLDHTFNKERFLFDCGIIADCEYVHDGFDTDDTEWFRCVVHDELMPSDYGLCNGYIELEDALKEGTKVHFKTMAGDDLRRFREAVLNDPEQGELSKGKRG